MYLFSLWAIILNNKIIVIVIVRFMASVTCRLTAEDRVLIDRSLLGRVPREKQQHRQIVIGR